MLKMLLRSLFLVFAVLGLIALQGCSDYDSKPDSQVNAPNVPTSVDKSSTQVASDFNSTYATLRKLDLSEDKTPPRMIPEENEDLRRVRNYPEQPPTIPHKIEFYQIDKNHNQCMDCHARANVGVSQAPMVSITHFMDRDGQFLASISARRYYCTQCHVAQFDIKPLVENEFVDVDTMVTYLEELKAQENKEH